MIASHLFAVVTALASAGSASQDGETRLLTDVLVVAFDGLGRFDVLSRGDLERALELETNKQAAGCTEASCLSELAGALGARLVVFGQLGKIDNGYVMVLNLYDSTAAASAGRTIVEGASVGAIKAKLPAAAAELVSKLPADPTQARTRLLVLDLAHADSGALAKDDASSPPTFVLVGSATAAGGVLLFVGAAVVGAFAQSEQDRASDPTLKQTAAIEAYDARDGLSIASIALGVAGGAALVGAGVVFASGLAEGGT